MTKTINVGYLKIGKPFGNKKDDKRGIDSEAIHFKELVRQATKMSRRTYLDKPIQFNFINIQESLINGPDCIDEIPEIHVLFILNGKLTPDNCKDEYNTALSKWLFLQDTLLNLKSVYYIQIDPALYFDIDTLYSLYSSVSLSDRKPRKPKADLIYEEFIPKIKIISNSRLVPYSENQSYLSTPISSAPDLISYVRNSVELPYTRALYSYDNGSDYIELPLSCYRYIKTYEDAEIALDADREDMQKESLKFENHGVREHELAYIGSVRGGHREKAIKRFYYPGAEQQSDIDVCIFTGNRAEISRLFDMDMDQSDRTDIHIEGPVNFTEVPNVMRNTFSTVLIGDKIYERLNVIAPRYLEALEADALCFISSNMMSTQFEQDIRQILSHVDTKSQDEFLDFIVVDSFDEVREKINRILDNINSDDEHDRYQANELYRSIMIYQRIILDYHKAFYTSNLIEVFKKLVSLETIRFV